MPHVPRVVREAEGDREAKGDIVNLGAEGDIVNCESVPGQMGNLSVSFYSPHSMRAIHCDPWGPSTRPRYTLGRDRE